ncbi:MAG: GIY-YIG nuclease family protein [Firmicutes bacterium]|nr:GIY-YIG nuclease family protein [Bacillota bacterium]
MDRKKELKQQYKMMKPAMGIFMIRAKFSNKCYLEATPNLKGAINSGKFKHGAGIQVNRELQKDWHKYGENGFIIEILETLEYDRDEAKTDYTEELELLQMLWEEKMAAAKMEMY